MLGKEDVRRIRGRFESLESLDGVRKAWVQPKLDGEFNVLVKEGDSAYLINRFGTIRRKGYKILSDAMYLADGVYLGELHYNDGKAGDLYQLTSNKTNKNLRLALFDIYPQTKKYSQRYKELCTSLSKPTKYLYIMPTKFCDSDTQVKEVFETYSSRGYEGIVVRNGFGVYKYKQRHEVDAVIIGMSKKNKSYSEKMCSSICLGLFDNNGKLVHIGNCNVTSTQRFDIGTLRKVLYKKIQEYKTHEDSRYVWCEPLAVVTVTYSSVCEGGLREPRLERIRDDKPIEDCSIYQIRR